MLMFIVTVMGVVGVVVFGILGLRPGGGHELEQIFAIASVAMAAAGLLGMWGPRYDRIHHLRVPEHD
jgi:hypothetical protein